MRALFRRDPNRGVAANTGAAGALTGTYDIKGDKIMGFVHKVPPVRNGTIRVQAWRGNVLVAECEAGPDTGRIEVPFTMAFAGKFSVADLAREFVVLTARNHRGDTGQLTMAGLTRIELIREYMGVPSEAILDLSFGQVGNARKYLGEGWSADEGTFTWTLGYDSFVHFISPKPSGLYLLRIRYSAFLTTFVRGQRMEVWVNEHIFSSFNENQMGGTHREIRVSGNCFRDTSTSSLRFHHPDAVRPCDVEPVLDDRSLAFSFSRLSLVRALDDVY